MSSCDENLEYQDFTYEDKRYLKDKDNRLFTTEGRYAGWVDPERGTIWIEDHVGWCLRSLAGGDVDWETVRSFTRMNK